MRDQGPEIYISLDHETDGPCSGINNMLTFGAAAFTLEGKIIDKFYARLFELPYLRPNPSTMVWWRGQNSKAYKEAFDVDLPGVFTSSASQPRITAFDAMINFRTWLNRIGGQYKTDNFIAMAWPASFDFAFTNYYCHSFLSENPLGYACLDMRSYLMGLLRKESYYSLKESQINRLFGKPDRDKDLVSHIAVDDAIEQGQKFFYIKNHPLASIEFLEKEAQM